MVTIGNVTIASGMMAGHLLSTEFCIRNLHGFSDCSIMNCPTSHDLVMLADAPDELDELLWLRIREHLKRCPGAVIPLPGVRRRFPEPSGTSCTASLRPVQLL
jgi:hypothetical protein